MKWYPLAGACLLVIGLVCTVEAEVYKLVDLGTFGGNHSRAYGINESGQVVGYARNSDNERRAFLWDQGVMTDLGSLPGATSTTANDINESGQVVGDSGGRPVLWSNGEITDLGTFGGPSGSATAINNLGQAVGNARIGDEETRAVLWSNGEITDLGTLGWPWGRAYDINDSGQVVGQARLSQSTIRAFLWEEETGMVDLGTLGGPDATASGINDLGQIVGGAAINNYDGGAFLWSSDDGMTNLGRFPGADGALANGINDSGLVVGYSRLLDGEGNFVEWAPFLCSDGTMTNLNDLIDPNLGWHLDWANDINNQGQIVGFGVVNGKSRAYLLNPVPEPASITLMLCGALAGLLWWRRKGRK